MAFLKTLVLFQQQLLLDHVQLPWRRDSETLTVRWKQQTGNPNPTNGFEPSNMGQISRDPTLRITFQVVKGGVNISLGSLA